MSPALLLHVCDYIFVASGARSHRYRFVANTAWICYLEFLLGLMITQRVAYVPPLLKAPIVSVFIG